MDRGYLEQLFGLQGKVAVLTGGGGVLVSAMGRALAKVGVKVAILDIALPAAERVVGEIREAGGEAIAVGCNVLDKGSLQAAADAVIAAFGQVDILVNGAGGNKKEATTAPDLAFFDLPADAVNWVFNLNFIGTLLPCQVLEDDG